MQAYAKVWQVLEDLAIELKRRGVNVPQETIDDLRSAKTTITVYERDPTYPDNVLQVEMLLGKVEASLVYIAEANFGRTFADEYQRKILDARTVKLDTEAASSRFIPGIPSGEHWIRFKPKGAQEKRTVEQLVEKLELSLRAEANGSLIIHGSENSVKELVRKIAEKTRKEKRGE